MVLCGTYVQFIANETPLEYKKETCGGHLNNSAHINYSRTSCGLAKINSLGRFFPSYFLALGLLLTVYAWFNLSSRILHLLLFTLNSKTKRRTLLPTICDTRLRLQASTRILDGPE